MSQLRKKALSRFRASNPEGGRDTLAAAIAYHREGKFGQAATIYGRILDQDPLNFDALHLLGMAAHQTGDHQGALAMLEKALAVRPDSADALSNRSAVLMELGLYERALDSCEASLALDEDNAEAHFNAANALSKLGRRREAITRYQAALALNADFPAAMTNMAGEHIELGEWQLAVDQLDKALSLDPHHREAWLNLGVVFQEAGQHEQAFAAYENALKVDGTYVKALTNLSTLHLNLGGLSVAKQCAEAGLQLSPNSAEMHNALGNCLRMLGEPQAAANHFRLAVCADPNSPGFHSNLLLTMLGDPLETGATVCNEALRFGARFPAPSAPVAKPGRSLERVGFVSGDLKTHPVGFFLEPLLAGLAGVETVLYANQTALDTQSERLSSLASQWKCIAHASVSEAARQIVEDHVDILIDLSGHTSDGLLELFALKPAPVQVSWLGYSGTTGLGQFDALIGDAVVTPYEHEDDYAEPILRHTHGFAPIFRPQDPVADSPLPARTNGFVTFGSFNAPSKMETGVLEAWAAVLNQTPGSRMIFKNLYMNDPTLQARILGVMTAHGVEEGRITFLGQTSRAEHFAVVSKVDIALDTFPYSGATTTLDCLWSGVPVVTILGDRYAGRMAASFLETLGLRSLVATSAPSFVELAVSLAKDFPRLESLRSELPRLLEGSPAADPSTYAAEFLVLLKGLWQESARKAA